MARKIKKILLIHPNYAWLNKRTWQYPPYTLCLLKSVIGPRYDTVVLDPNFHNLTQQNVAEQLKKIDPDVVGVTSISTEYFNTTQLLISIIKQTLPRAVIIYGGVIPTVMPEVVMKDRNVDYWVMGEAETSLPRLLEELQKKSPSLDKIGGLAYWSENKAILNPIKFDSDLDAIPFPDYSQMIGGPKGESITLAEYGHVKLKYVPSLLANNYPFTVTITSRGCPYGCVFCAGRTISGQKVRFRSAENVLAEVDQLYGSGMKEIVFLDDHFLADRKRAIQIMQGLIDRKYKITWKCANVTVWLLDKEILGLMLKSGCNFLAVSIESGNQTVLKNIIKKPINLKIAAKIISMAKSMGFNILVNFVIGFPDETWDQIRDTFRFAESLDVDIASFHIATPLPKTELMENCMSRGLLPADYMDNISEYSGYGKGLITTEEFTPFELQVLRSFEWDRINFASSDRRKAVARLNGITDRELESWRRNTRRSVGINSLVKNIMEQSDKKESR